LGAPQSGQDGGMDTPENQREEPDTEVIQEEGRTPPPEDPQDDPASNPPDENVDKYRGG
jgi:hypothetical protein